MNVVPINLKANMGMNVIIHLHYGWKKLHLHDFNK
jgi:hypothetical protein